MAEVTEYGAVILPPMPAFYHQPKTIADLVDQTVGKVLDQFGIDHDLYRRWRAVAARPASDRADGAMNGAAGGAAQGAAAGAAMGPDLRERVAAICAPITP